MMRFAPLLLTLAVVATACSGGSDGEVAPTSVAPVTKETTVTTESEPPTTPDETTTTIAPTTTIDAQAILAEAEAAYLEAFEVGKEVLRNPDDPSNEARIREHFTGANLDKALESLQLTVDGNFVAKENSDNPSLATIVEGAEFVDGDTSLVRMTVCEFNSDRIYEIGTAPDGGETLVRDDPVSFLFVTQVELVEGRWKSKTGGEADEIRDEVERCTSA